MLQDEIETILDEDSEFSALVDKFTSSRDFLGLTEASTALFIMDLSGSTSLLNKRHAKIHEFRQAIKNRVDANDTNFDGLFAGLAGFNIEKLIDEDTTLFMVKHLAQKNGNTYKASLLANAVLKSIFTGQTEKDRKSLDSDGAWDLTKAIASSLHYKLNPSARITREPAMFEEVFDKKNRGKINAYFGRNFTERVLTIWAIAENIPGITPSIFSDYVGYKIGEQTSLMEFRSTKRREFKKLDEKVGLQVSTIINTMYNDAIVELKLTSLSAKTSLWHMIHEFITNAIAMQSMTASIPSIISTAKVSQMAPAIIQQQIEETLRDRMEKATKDMKRSFPDKSMENALDFTKQSFATIIGLDDNPAILKDMNIKFGIPLQKMFISIFKDAEKNLSASTTRSLGFVADSIFPIIESTVPAFWYEAADYTFDDLHEDLEKGFGPRIDSLLAEMKTQPGADVESLLKIFNHYTNNAANRVIVEYKDIAPMSTLDRKYNNQINFLLKEMYEYGINAIQTTVFEIRFSVWNQINRVLKEHIVKSAPKEKTTKIRELFERKLKPAYLSAVELLADSILVKMGSQQPISLSISESQQALLLYFQEQLRVLLDKQNVLSKDLVETARGYFDDIESALFDFTTEIRAAALSNADSTSLYEMVYDAGRDYIHSYLAKHEMSK